MPNADDEDSKPADEPRVILGDAIRSFADNLIALRDFVTLVGSLLSGREKKFLRQHRHDLTPFFVGVSELLKEPKPSPEQADKLTEELGYELTVQVAAGTLSIGVKGAEKAVKIGKAFKAIATSEKHRSLLYRSALISLVSSAEWFLSQVMRQHFELHQDAIGIKDKLLSLEELRTFGSVADAQEYLIDLRINEIMWGGFDDWLKYLTEKIKLSASYLKPSKDKLTEIFQRRNVMVHNNGVAHSSYINKVSADLRKEVSVGDEMSVSPEYLNSAIDLIEATFILLGCELWKQVDPKDENRGSVLIDIAFERLTQEKWFVAERLSFFLRNDKQLPEREQTVGMLNHWQSLKWQGKFEEVKEEVEKADFSDKDELYQLARYALLDRPDDFIEVLPDVIRAKKLDSEKLNSWPIFREMRKTQEYRHFIESLGQELGLIAFPTEPSQQPVEDSPDLQRKIQPS